MLSFKHVFSVALFTLGSLAVVSCTPDAPTSSGAETQTEAQDLTHKLEAMNLLLQASHDRGVLNGNVLIAKGGEIIYEKSFGYTSGETTQKLTSESVFNSGSIAKEFNAVAIMILEERGLLSLEDPVSKHLLGLPKWADDVQIQHLLDYTSGLPPVHWNSVISPDDVMSDLMKIDSLPFPAGEGYIYSNNNVFLQRLIVEAVTGIRFSEFVQDNIIEPAGMTTAIIDPMEDDKNLVQAFNHAGENDPYMDMPMKGWVHGTARDMFKWMQALYGLDIISSDSIEILAKSRSPRELGSLMLGNIVDGKLVYHKHHGSSLQWEALILNDVEHDLLIVILTNKKERKLFDLMAQLEAINKGEAYDIPKASLYSRLNGLCSESVETCLDAYDTWKFESPEAYDFENKSALNSLGYRALGRSDVDGAIQIFSKFVAEFPDWSNAYDSLGEAYMIDAQYEVALENYARALELDPSNENAQDMIEDIKLKMVE